MTYVDGFVIPVPKSKVAAYRRMAKQGAGLWMKYGALEYRECIADALVTVGPDGKKQPSLFPKLAKAKRNETVFFSYIVYESKAQRDRINKKVMADPSMKDFDMADMPFDLKRMAYAGFKPVVEAVAGERRSTKRSRRPRAVAARVANGDRTEIELSSNA